MKTKLIIISLIATFTSYAQNAFQDDFSTYTPGLKLDGQGPWTSNSSNGGLGSCGPLNTCFSLVSQAPISYAGWGSSITSVELKNDSDSNGTIFTAITSNVVYFGMVINVTNASGTPQDCFRVSTGNFATAFRLYIRAAGGDTFNVGALKGTTISPTYATGAYNYNQEHLIIFKYSKFAGTNDDILDIFVDPNYANGEPAIPSVSMTNGTDQTGNIDRIAFRQNAGSGTIPTGFAGLISLASTWEDLTFTLGTEQFNSNAITISSNNVKNGILNLQSNVAMDSATLKIISTNGSLIENRKVTIEAATNEINITPIQTKGMYIVELTGTNGKRFTQKILVN